MTGRPLPHPRPVAKRRKRFQVLLPVAVVAVIVVTATVALVLHSASDSGDDPGERQCPAPSSAVAATSDQWVQRDGADLTLGGKPWRFAGVNEFWLGLNDDTTYPSSAEIDDGLAAARETNAKLVRSISMGVSVGTPKSIEPQNGVWNDDAFAPIDHAVAEARKCGLRLMVPLTDQNHYYHGGKHTFTNWLGHPDITGLPVSDPAQRDREAAFYYDSTVIDAYHDYIAHVLDHVNPLTKLRLGDDPTIAIWETGNELYDAPSSWTGQTAQFIHSKAPRALVADGSASSGTQVQNSGVDQPDVDIVDAHFYPTDTTKAASDAEYVTGRDKVFMVGEYPLTGYGLDAWLRSLADNPAVAGDLAWSLLPYDSDGSPVGHNDGYTFHVPGATKAERRQVAALTAHARSMT